MSSSPVIGVFVSTSVSPGDGKDSGVEICPERIMGVREGDERRPARGVEEVMVMERMMEGVGVVEGFIRLLVQMVFGFC